MEFKKYFDENVTFQKLNKGITNYNYLSSNGYIVKKYSNLVANNEVKLHSLVKDFDVEIKTINKEVKIAKFIKEAKTLEDDPINEVKVRQIANIIKKLHDKKIKTDITFEPRKVIKDYLDNIVNPMYDYDKFMFLIDKINKIYCDEKDKVLCHNDLTPGNFLFTPNKLYLIDWEYAGMNDPIFDVVSFLNENDLYDTKYKRIFLNEYFKNEKYNEGDLDLWNDFQNLMWCAWANMLYDQRPDQIYVHIAKYKMQRLEKRVIND